MSEINMDFSFPAAPAIDPAHATSLAPPFSHQPRPLSFSPQSRPRKHAHRRSAAMSEDLTATDLSELTAPQLAASPIARRASSPGSVSLRSGASGASGVSGVSGTSGTNSTGAGPSAPSLVTFAAPPAPVVHTPSGSSAPIDAGALGSADVRDAWKRMPFPGSPSPNTPLRQLGNVGEPGQLVPASPSVSPSPHLAAFPSPGDESVRRTKNRTKRRSFVSVFRRSRDFDAGEDDTLTTHDLDDTLPLRLASPTPLTALPAPPSPDAASPILTPRNSGELVRELEPDPPSIDLDEALSCSFEHRRPEGILDSPFSKASSTIGPVLEEEEESDLDTVASASQRWAASLDKTNSVHSSYSLGRSIPKVPRPLSAAPPILLSPSSREYAPYSQTNTAATSTKATFIDGAQHSPTLPETDPLSHLAIAEPTRAVPATPEPPRLEKSRHARRRSLISRLIGRS